MTIFVHGVHSVAASMLGLAPSQRMLALVKAVASGVPSLLIRGVWPALATPLAPWAELLLARQYFPDESLAHTALVKGFTIYRTSYRSTTAVLGDVTSSAVQLPLKSVSQPRIVASEQLLEEAAEQTEAMEEAPFEVSAFRRGETHDWIWEAPFRLVRKAEQPLEIDDGIGADLKKVEKVSAT